MNLAAEQAKMRIKHHRKGWHRKKSLLGTLKSNVISNLQSTEHMANGSRQQRN